MSYSVEIVHTVFDAVAGAAPIVAELPNGTFVFTIENVLGWRQSTPPYSPQSAIQGPTGFHRTLDFALTVYDVGLAQVGIPSDFLCGRSWSRSLSSRAGPSGSRLAKRGR
ncbi:MAG: hypothetical protein ACREBT_04780 [Thermoplasmata archaeon]